MEAELRIDLDTNFEAIPAFSISPASGNAIIEGDNLSALYFLDSLPEAAGGVDFMYWDPPYNTGRKGFYYNDDRSSIDEENGESHWSRFIRNRMEYARHLLKDNGCLACHIDERELRRLWRIMDKVFGHRNFFGLITWQSSKGTGGRISNTTEFILVFAKNAPLLRKNLPLVNYPTENAHHFKNPDNDPEGPWRGRIKAGRTRAHQYGIEDYNTGLFVTPTFGWRHTPERMVARFLAEGLDYEYDKVNYRLKLRTKPVLTGVLPQYYFKDGELRRKEYLSKRNNRKSSLHTLIEGPGMRAEEGTKTFRQIMGVHPLDFNFQTVKPVPVCKKLIRHLCPENGLVVDAFAGTGTTAQALLELNREYGHSRRFILIERGGWQKGGKLFPVNEILAERVRRVISGDWHSHAQPATGGGFNYYRVASTPAILAPPSDPYYFYLMELVERGSRFNKLIKIGVSQEKGGETRRRAHEKTYRLYCERVEFLQDWLFESENAANMFETALKRKLWKQRGFKIDFDEVFRLSEDEITEFRRLKTAEELRAYVETLS